jgi:ATP-dependent Clp protease ATP-binding subunit ClpC
VYERFTADARQVVMFAQDEARALGHGSVGTDHLLLALLRVEYGAGARALRGLGLTLDRARSEVERISGRGSATTHGSIPFVPRLRRTLDVAMQEAMSLGHEAVGTEHLAFALVAERDGATAQILRGVADPEVVRDAVLEAMRHPPERESDPAAAPAADVPAAVTLVIGEDVRRLLRRAAGLALAEDADQVAVGHVRRALDPEDP